MNEKLMASNLMDCPDCAGNNTECKTCAGTGLIEKNEVNKQQPTATSGPCERLPRDDEEGIIR